MTNDHARIYPANPDQAQDHGMHGMAPQTQGRKQQDATKGQPEGYPERLVWLGKPHQSNPSRFRFCKKPLCQQLSSLLTTLNGFVGVLRCQKHRANSNRDRRKNTILPRHWQRLRVTQTNANIGKYLAREGRLAIRTQGMLLHALPVPSRNFSALMTKGMNV